MLLSVKISQYGFHSLFIQLHKHNTRILVGNHHLCGSPFIHYIGLLPYLKPTRELRNHIFLPIPGVSQIFTKRSK